MCTNPPRVSPVGVQGTRDRPSLSVKPRVECVSFAFLEEFGPSMINLSRECALAYLSPENLRLARIKENTGSKPTGIRV